MGLMMFSCKWFAVLVCVTVLLANTAVAAESEDNYLVRFLWDDTEYPGKVGDEKGARNIFGEGETAGDGETEFGEDETEKVVANSFVAAAAGPVMASPVIDSEQMTSEQMTSEQMTASR